MNMDAMIDEVKKVLDRYKAIGIFLSGGLDSSLLAYLLHTYKTPEHKFVFYTVPRHDDSVLHAQRIINYLDQKFNCPSRTLIKRGDPDLHHSQQVLSGIRLAVKEKKVDVLLLGDTAMPYETELASQAGAPERVKSSNPFVEQPFLGFTKKDTVQLAVEMKLDELINLTHSCTQSVLLRCNACWQCQERAWAFRECGYTDTGTM